MLKGDLASAPLAEILRQLADGAATGCIHLADPAGESAKVYLRGGRVYAVMAPGRRPALGSRLVSSGALGPEALAEALEAQRTELQGWRLGELLVHLGYVDQPVVEAFVDEQVRESLSDLLPWGSGTWKFRVNERTREDVAPPVAVDDLLAEISERRATWASFQDLVGGADAVPLLSAAGTSDSEMEIDPDAWSLLCKVDGVRTLTELARECGFTLYEAGRVVHGLVAAGLLDVETEPHEEEPPPGEAFVPGEVASRLLGALGGYKAVPPQGDAPAVERSTAARALDVPHTTDEVDGSISRVSAALSSLLGPATAGDDLFGAPMSRSVPEPVVEDPKKVERARREAARRERDADELATAQAELEAARAAQQAERDADLPADHVAQVVDLGSVRREAEAEAARVMEEQRIAGEVAAAEAVRAAEEQRAADEAAAAEAARIAEEQRAADEAAAAEAARIAEEQRLAGEAAEAARIAEEQRLAHEAAAAEAARAAEEQRAADEAAADEAARAAEEQRVADEAAADEAARIAEEQRVADEAAADEAARIAEEQRLADEAAAAEAARAAEEQRLAAEAARAAEEQRLADEAAADEAARAAEDQRLAHEAAADEAARAAEEQRPAHEAAADEAARIADEQRLDAEAELAATAHADADAAMAAAAAEFASFVDDAPPALAPEDARALAETQAAAFAELSASASIDVPEPVAVAAAPAYVPDEPAPSFHNDTDTASLLRELSFLGLDDDPPPPPPTRPAAPRPVQAPAKKKKGLFGRS